MEEININWCKQHDMAFVYVNVARDTSYYLEKEVMLFLSIHNLLLENKKYI